MHAPRNTHHVSLRYPFYQLANSLGNSAPRFLLNLLTAAIVVTLGIRQVAGSPAGLAAFLGMATLALLLDSLIAVLIGLSAFWIEEVMPAFWIYQKLLFTVGGMFLPLEMFPQWLRRIAGWLPFQFITYAPARAFVAFEPGFVMRSMAGQVMVAVVLVVLITVVMLLFFWWVLFNRLPTLRGWNLAGVMTLYGVVAFGFGAATAFCGNAFLVARVIVSGDLDYYLALPADPLVHLLVSRMSLSSWGDVLFGLLVFLVAAPGRWMGLPLFLLLGGFAGLILVAFSVLVGSLAFWVGNADNLATQAINALITFGTYPVEIFPGVVRVLLYTLIPAAFVGSVPARLLSDFQWEQMGLLVAFTAGLALAARGVFYWGLRRYESGNLVTVRG